MSKNRFLYPLQVEGVIDVAHKIYLFWTDCNLEVIWDFTCYGRHLFRLSGLGRDNISEPT